MADLALSPQRRTALTDLVGDESTFSAAYPRVADYWSTVGRLPGTGDDIADATFDLHLLHYMTGGASTNPYWDIVAAAVSSGPPERAARPEVNGGNPKGSARLAYAQILLQAAYAYAIPSPATVRWVADVTEGRPILEVGSGRGYWAHQLTRIGVPTTAFDSHPPDLMTNTAFPAVPGQLATWHPTATPPASTADLAAAHADDVLFLCWPPGWEDPMASTTLTAYQEAGGCTLVYIGESRGGRTADTAFFDILDAEWTRLDQDPDYVSWWNLGDTAQCWQRR
ncbi:hypothetical protein OHA40_14975 [Nocardia sp. NBC_00508]|uniref:hypothetical protein n=1 Tax=Nocardia sp. NBC_00508 TaxID=2975992 RepID=UPI002E7FDD69|nr:hypothetical protein [Nocardia sp. NBC_00508]WUD69308.1 hypothetical protein OHA40_14975 [Nocardia sp. NBC_00508]